MCQSVLLTEAVHTHPVQPQDIQVLQWLWIWRSVINNGFSNQKLYLSTQASPDTFQQVAAGKTRGEQTIGRAELQALLILIAAIPCCEVFSDSAYALGILLQVQQGASLDSFSNKDNLDLISQAFQIDLSKVLLRKIKAHQCPKDIQCPLSRYHVLGNSYADLCAGRACNAHNQQWGTALQRKTF